MPKAPHESESIEAALNRNYPYLLAASVILSITIALPRFASGIPMSVDTTSHLYKILFLQLWWKQGVNPYWSPDWYAGSPALLLYPPLGYYLTALVAMLGVDPVIAYKIVDAFFYCIAPVTIYCLSRELGFANGESGLAALIFSAFPEVVENYIFFDRFPTTLAIPVFCIFVIFFHRALTKSKATTYLILSTLTMSALLLIHHLSALIAGIVAVLMVIFALASKGLVRPTLQLCAVAAGTFGITAFWLVPFLQSYRLFSANEFYNRNVTFPFLRFTYFGYDVVSYLLGIAQFVLAALALQSIVGRNFGPRLPLKPAVFFAPLLASMAIFQAGELISLQPLEYLAEFIIALSFTGFLAQFILSPSARKVLSRSDGTILAAFWFLIFLWLGLGLYALPILQLPIIYSVWKKTMDVYRIWLYMALPFSPLVARGLLRSATKLVAWRPVSVALLLVLTVTPATISLALKVNYDLTHQVNGVLPYSTANTEIPSALINYFRNDPSQGRILGVDVPFWIYLLPIYVNKPIVDGWYPQTKLVTQLVNITDYRIDDLETTAPKDRLTTWKGLISQAQLLDITWVMVGNATLGAQLMQGSGFDEQLSIPYEGLILVVYKSDQPSSLIQGRANLTDISRPNPDLINIKLEPSGTADVIVVKEAYFPTWAARADGNLIPVLRDPGTGYILITAPAGTRQLALFQKPDNFVWNALSMLSLITCLGLLVVTRYFRHGRRR